MEPRIKARVETNTIIVQTRRCFFPNFIPFAIIYEVNWRRVWKEKRSRLRRLSRGTNRGKWLVRISGLVMAALVAGAVGMVILFAWYAKDLPNPDRIVRREGFATKLYDRGGQLLYDVFSEKKRTR